MAQVGYDSLEGVLRLTSAGEREVDPFVVEVLTYHAALELEMDHLIARMLPRPDRLQVGGLGFKHKISLINAAWRGRPEDGDLLADALTRYNDLRNAVAHADQHRGVERIFSALSAAGTLINPDQAVNPTPYDVAVSICAFMGEDPGGRRLLRTLGELDDVINSRLPKAFKTSADDET
ncbi:hypothetical protein [Rhizobium leguminosarum]|uniref:hypothetical protein n=1 Tax=Rhizobium leguminosarum TaxID=384 RepID=UPI00102F4779|nr:hypothetical protein [Rhizobium leguminosarum]TAU83262.1 hypothetical protein ELI40_08215 [Rhizobium leguminosarum]